MTDNIRRYPIGIQTFEKLRKENFFYIDKTEYVYRIAHSNAHYMFLEPSATFRKVFADQYASCLF